MLSVTDSAELQLRYRVNNPHREAHKGPRPLDHRAADDITNPSHNTHITAAADLLDLFCTDLYCIYLELMIFLMGVRN